MEGFITVGTFASEAETNSVSRDMNPETTAHTHCVSARLAIIPLDQRQRLAIFNKKIK